MNRTALAAALASTILLAGCGKTLDFRNAEISNNKIYEAGANTGFSGKVTNIPYTRLPVAPVGSLIQILTRMGKDESIANTLIASSLGGGDGGLLCDIKAADGTVDGKAICKVNGSKSPLFEIEFDHNAVQGHTIIYNPKLDGAKMAEANYVDNKLDGELKLYSADGKTVVDSANLKQGVAHGVEEQRSPNNGKLVHRMTWVDGKLQGKEEVWSEDGTQLAQLDWQNGRQTGFEKRLAKGDNHVLADLKWQDGKQTGFETLGSDEPMSTGYSRVEMRDGVRHGELRQYALARTRDGLALYKVEHYVNGKLDGKVLNYGENGEVASFDLYKDGTEISYGNAPDETGAPPAGGNCVDAKVAAFHKESGEDAMVTADMLGEWEGACKKPG